MLKIVFQNKNKMPEKIVMPGLFIRSYNYIPTISKLFGYNFWWKCLEFNDKICVTIRMRISINVKHRGVYCRNL